MLYLELLVLRLVLWIGLPLLLLVLAVGPNRVRRGLHKGWDWLWNRRLDPEEVLTRIVEEHQEHVAALRQALARSEAAEADIRRNTQKSQDNIATFEAEATAAISRGDDLGAKGALYKLNLEKLAVDNFHHQLERQREHMIEARRRLYLLELQLRQYEVGRSILLSQLAEARTVEQQYAIASHFDPFSAVANWQRAEGLVQEKAQTARAVEQVFVDTADMPLAGQPLQADLSALDAQLMELKAKVSKTDNLFRLSESQQTRNGH